MSVLAWADAVDIGLGRGRLAREAAASLARVDIAMRSAFGRAADINEAWRSPETADENYAKYQAYLRDPRRNPWAPIALPADESVHCKGYAVDTDDTSDAQMRIWNEHGWYWTVYRNNKLAERWHLEYFRDRDKHRNDPSPASNDAKPLDVEPPKRRKRTMINAAWRNDSGTIAVQARPGGRVTQLQDINEWNGIHAATGAEFVQVSDAQLDAIGTRFGGFLVSPNFDDERTGQGGTILVPNDGQADRYATLGDRAFWIDQPTMDAMLAKGAVTLTVPRSEINARTKDA